VKIYTKTGDTGETSLMGGGRVPKDDARVAAYGDVDETSAAIQQDLFAIGGSLATPEPERLKEAQRAKLRVPADRIAELERAIDEADRELPPLKAFVLPGGTPKAAALHLARTVCRRAERSVIHLTHQEDVPPEIVVYLNRLSDLLFTLARLANHRAESPDQTW
jgi:cob(I)alamin adenosyltransferase